MARKTKSQDGPTHGHLFGLDRLRANEQADIPTRKEGRMPWDVYGLNGPAFREKVEDGWQYCTFSTNGWSPARIKAKRGEFIALYLVPIVVNEAVPFDPDPDVNAQILQECHSRYEDHGRPQLTTIPESEIWGKPPEVTELHWAKRVERAANDPHVQAYEASRVPSANQRGLLSNAKAESAKKDAEIARLKLELSKRGKEAAPATDSRSANT